MLVILYTIETLKCPDHTDIEAIGDGLKKLEVPHDRLPQTVVACMSSETFAKIAFQADEWGLAAPLMHDKF